MDGCVEERFYKWNEDENPAIGFKSKGDLKAFGVCDEPWQINLRNSAKSYLGSMEYIERTYLPGQFGFSSYPNREGSYKCNIFVAHRALQIGIFVPVMHGIFGAYPPLANEWYDITFQIEGWYVLSDNAYPQAGFVVATEGQLHGHMGIVDFDGQVISAGMKNVNRFMPIPISTTMRKYQEEK